MLIMKVMMSKLKMNKAIAIKKMKKYPDDTGSSGKIEISQAKFHFISFFKIQGLASQNLVQHIPM